MNFHWQNLKKEDRTKHLLYGRCWLGHDLFHAEWSIPSNFYQLKLSLNSHGETAIGFHLAVGLFSIYLSTENRKLFKFLQPITKRKDQKYTNGRVIGISYHSGTLWCSLWEDPMEWRSKDPKWWKFNINFADLLFGKAKYSEKILDEGDTVIDMPEGVYEATYKRFISFWKRPRLPFAKHIDRISLTLPVGIPHEGKGENSWDCGMDATYGSTFPASQYETLYEITKRFAFSCLEERKKYGSLNSPEYAKWREEGLEKLKTKKTEIESTPKSKCNECWYAHAPGKCSKGSNKKLK